MAIVSFTSNIPVVLTRQLVLLNRIRTIYHLPKKQKRKAAEEPVVMTIFFDGTSILYLSQ